MRFIIVEYPDRGSPMPDFTRDHPGATVDVIAERVVGLPDGDRMHPCVALVRGAPWAAIEDLVAAFETIYESVVPLQRDPRAGRWLGRMKIRESTFRHTATYNVMLFQQRFGAPWAHLEGGVIHLRARVADPGQGKALAADMRRSLDELGIDAQVEERELGARDYGVWDELVQHTIGLS